MTKREVEAAREAARVFGRMGGLVGGRRRARSLTAAQRSAVARLGAQATNRKRWGTKPKRRARKLRAK